MRYQLFHNELDTFDVTQTLFRPKPTAFVEAESFDDVVRLTNHIDSNWYENPGVSPCLRSTSVGDLIIDARGTQQLVAPIGFITPPPATSLEKVIHDLRPYLHVYFTDAKLKRLLASATHYLEQLKERQMADAAQGVSHDPTQPAD